MSLCAAIKTFFQNAAILAMLAFSFVVSNEFSYAGSEGPSHWGEKYKECSGKRQSPINIQVDDAVAAQLPPLIWKNFDATPHGATITNTGHTAAIMLKPKELDKMPTIAGGPINGVYEFAQMHFHWGSNDREGSEHLRNNKSFPMELHMVFFQQQYGNFSQALEYPDGLTILSFFYTKRESANKNYDPIINTMPGLKNVHASSAIKSMPALNALIANNRSVYFTYEGSLTTPPCSEIATWIQFYDAIPIAHFQIDAFRHLKGPSGKLISRNFRPTQPLHGRLVRMVDERNILQYPHNAKLTDANRGSSNMKLQFIQNLTFLLILRG